MWVTLEDSYRMMDEHTQLVEANIGIYMNIRI
jgi:hypothetical protein